MVYRRLRILVWLTVPVLLATYVIGSSAGPAVRADAQPSFRIVTPGASEVMTQDVTPEIAGTLHMSHTEGVLVTDVLPSPLHQGDVILAVNGSPVKCGGDLNALLARIGPGEPFYLEVFRDGAPQTLTVQRVVDAPVPAAAQGPVGDIRGIKVASLSTQNGVVVTEVHIGTAASSGGMKPGDIILQIDGHPVHSADEFLKFMRQLNNLDATFNVRQADGELSVFVIPSQP